MNTRVTFTVGSPMSSRITEHINWLPNFWELSCTMPEAQTHRVDSNDIWLFLHSQRFAIGVEIVV